MKALETVGLMVAITKPEGSFIKTLPASAGSYVTMIEWIAFLTSDNLTGVPEDGTGTFPNPIHCI
jgi:hypothetical protein